MGENQNKQEPKPETVQQAAVDTLLERGIDFDVTVANPGILHRLRIRPTKRTFRIRPITLGALLQISKLCLEIDPDMPGDTDLFAEGLRRIVKHKDALVKSAAYAIRNSDDEPPAGLLRYLSDNLTANELMILLMIIKRQMGVRDFFVSTALTAGMNLMNKAASGKTSGEQSEA